MFDETKPLLDFMALTAALCAMFVILLAVASVIGVLAFFLLAGVA